jgi:protein-tyrosine phosphatase
VVDPYYGGAHGFEENLDMIEDAVQGLIREITGENRVKMRPGG